MAEFTEDEQAIIDAYKAGQNEPGDEGGESGDGKPEGDTGEAAGEAGEAAGSQEAAGEESGEGAAEGDEDYVEVESLRVGDRDIPVEDIQTLLEFQQWTKDNPDKMAAFGQYLRGEAEFVVRQQQEAQAAAAAAEAAKPENQIDWDLVDPAVKAVYESQQKSQQEMQQRLDALQNPIQAWQQQQVEEANRQATDQIHQATAKVNEKLGLDLTAAEIDELHTTTAKLNILPGLRASIADPVEAVATALEMAVWQTPKFKDKLVDSQVASARANDKRDLAGKVAGVSGSERAGVASSPTAADVRTMSKEDRTRAMAAEIAESMRGTPA